MVDTSYSQDFVFYGIDFNTGITTASSAEGNVIQNIQFRAKTPAFFGISIDGGLVNIGETAGNTISNISILSSSQGSGAAVGIRNLSIFLFFHIKQFNFRDHRAVAERDRCIFHRDIQLGTFGHK